MQIQVLLRRNINEIRFAAASSSSGDDIVGGAGAAKTNHHLRSRYRKLDEHLEMLIEKVRLPHCPSVCS